MHDWIWPVLIFGGGAVLLLLWVMGPWTARRRRKYHHGPEPIRREPTRRGKPRRAP